MLGLLQLVEHHAERVVAERKVFGIRIPVGGKAAALQIRGKPLRFGRQVRCLTGGGGGDEVLRLRLNVVVAPDHQPVAEVGADVEIQNEPEDRQDREDEKPRELDGRVVVVAEERQHDGCREQRIAAPKVGHCPFELIESEEEEQNLHDERDDDDTGAAEDDLQQTALALFQKQNAVVVVFHKNLLSERENCCFLYHIMLRRKKKVGVCGGM